MKFVNLLQMLYCEPWLIAPAMHKKLCEIVDAHIDGSAHTEEFEENTVKLTETRQYKVVDNIAVIPVFGVIGKRISELARSSGVLDIGDLDRCIQMAAENEHVEGIVLHVDSPGGTLTGVRELAQKIADVNKPVVAVTDRLMASAAYWLSASADLIYGTPTAAIGSIGVYMAWVDVSRQYELEGRKLELIRSGKMKGLGIEGTSLTQEQRDFFQNQVNQVFNWFKGFVLNYRDVPADALEGQTFFSENAVNRDLIDAIGDVEEAIKAAKALVNIRNENNE